MDKLKRIKDIIMTLEIDFMKPNQALDDDMKASAIQLTLLALEILEPLRGEIADLRRLRKRFDPLNFKVFASNGGSTGSVVFGLDEARKLEKIIFE